MSAELGLLAQQVAQQDLGRALLALLPPGASRVVLRTSALRAVSLHAASAVYPDGRSESLRLGRRLDLGLSARVREAMYREGFGTWFSAVFEVTAQGSLSAQFNYDEEPEWDAPVDPIAYVTDQDKFPRDEANQPDWLKRRLAEGRERIRDRQG